MVDQRFAVAVHIMTVLAVEKCEDGHLYTSEQLAKSATTNPTVVRRLLSRLVEAGILKSYKGKAGGVQLARCPNEITLADIYGAVTERTLLQSPKRKIHKACPTSCSMGKLMEGLIEGVESNSKKYLAKISLQDIAKKVEE